MQYLKNSALATQFEEIIHQLHPDAGVTIHEGSALHIELVPESLPVEPLAIKNAALRATLKQLYPELDWNENQLIIPVQRLNAVRFKQFPDIMRRIEKQEWSLREAQLKKQLQVLEIAEQQMVGINPRLSVLNDVQLHRHLFENTGKERDVHSISYSAGIFKKIGTDHLWLGESERPVPGIVGDEAVYLKKISSDIYAYYGGATPQTEISVQTFTNTGNPADVDQEAAHVMSYLLEECRPYNEQTNYNRAIPNRNREIHSPDGSLFKEQGLGVILAVADFLSDTNLLDSLAYKIVRNAEGHPYAQTIKTQPNIGLNDASVLILQTRQIRVATQIPPNYLVFDELPLQTQNEFLLTLHSIINTTQAEIINFFHRPGIELIFSHNNTLVQAIIAQLLDRQAQMKEHYAPDLHRTREIYHRYIKRHAAEQRILMADTEEKLSVLSQHEGLNVEERQRLSTLLQTAKRAEQDYKAKIHYSEQFIKNVEKHFPSNKEELGKYAAHLGERFLQLDSEVEQFNLQEVRQLRKEVEEVLQALKSLREQMDKDKEIAALQEQLATLQSQFVQVYRLSNEAAPAMVAEVEELAPQLEEEYRQQQQQIEVLEKKLGEKQPVADKGNDELLAAFRAKMEQAHRAMAGTNRALDIIRPAKKPIVIVESAFKAEQAKIALLQEQIRYIQEELPAHDPKQAIFREVEIQLIELQRSLADTSQVFEELQQSPMFTEELAKNIEEMQKPLLEEILRTRQRAEGEIKLFQMAANEQKLHNQINDIQAKTQPVELNSAEHVLFEDAHQKMAALRANLLKIQNTLDALRDKEITVDDALNAIEHLQSDAQNLDADILTEIQILEKVPEIQRAQAQLEQARDAQEEEVKILEQQLEELAPMMDEALQEDAESKKRYAEIQAYLTRVQNNLKKTNDALTELRRPIELQERDSVADLLLRRFSLLEAQQIKTNKSEQRILNIANNLPFFQKKHKDFQRAQSKSQQLRIIVGDTDMSDKDIKPLLHAVIGMVKKQYPQIQFKIGDSVIDDTQGELFNSCIQPSTSPLSRSRRINDMKEALSDTYVRGIICLSGTQGPAFGFEKAVSDAGFKGPPVIFMPSLHLRDRETVKSKVEYAYDKNFITGNLPTLGQNFLPEFDNYGLFIESEVSRMNEHFYSAYEKLMVMLFQNKSLDEIATAFDRPFCTFARHKKNCAPGESDHLECWHNPQHFSRFEDYGFKIPMSLRLLFERDLSLCASVPKLFYLAELLGLGTFEIICTGHRPPRSGHMYSESAYKEFGLTGNFILYDRDYKFDLFFNGVRICEFHCYANQVLFAQMLSVMNLYKQLSARASQITYPGNARDPFEYWALANVLLKFNVFHQVKCFYSVDSLTKHLSSAQQAKLEDELSRAIEVKLNELREGCSKFSQKIAALNRSLQDKKEIINRSLQDEVVSHCERGDLNAVQMAISQGACINLPDSQGRYPLHAAAFGMNCKRRNLI